MQGVIDGKKVQMIQRGLNGEMKLLQAIEIQMPPVVLANGPLVGARMIKKRRLPGERRGKKMRRMEIMGNIGIVSTRHPVTSTEMKLTGRLLIHRHVIIELGVLIPLL
jgi:hypothetical protein